MAISKIQSESMNLADTYAFSGTVSGAGVSGKVLQHTFLRNTTTVSVSNTTTVATAVSHSITPSATTSKVIINGQMQLLAYASITVNFRCKLVRTIGSTDTTLQEFLIYNTHGSGTLYPYNYSEVSFPFLDSPATTSAVTYKITFQSFTRSGSVYESRTNSNGGGSVMLLQEVAP
jgi:hypothetical protein|tara:strand:- start:478 stop:1002 length:525 start_codon:yes stop_codon:yes gene_type:complete